MRGEREVLCERGGGGGDEETGGATGDVCDTPTSLIET